MDRTYIADNTATRERLMTLVDQLSDDDLARSLSDGWTIAATLAHLAFWDHRVLVLLDRWKHAEVIESAADPDPINDAMRPLCLAIAPRTATRLAVEAAQAVDRELETLDPDLHARIVAAGTPIKYWRSEHRSEHLDEIERVLK